MSARPFSKQGNSHRSCLDLSLFRGRLPFNNPLMLSRDKCVFFPFSLFKFRCNLVMNKMQFECKYVTPPPFKAQIISESPSQPALPPSLLRVSCVSLSLWRNVACVGLHRSRTHASVCIWAFPRRCSLGFIHADKCAF